MRHVPITRDEFQTWLEVQGKNVVGWSQSWDDCPLARAVTERGDFVPGAFHGSHAVLYRPGLKYKQEWTYPVWAVDFIRTLDATHGEDLVTADMALGCLQRTPTVAVEVT